jgi:adenylate kinase family enzyme
VRHFQEISAPNYHISVVNQLATIITKEFESATFPTIVAIGGPGGVGKSRVAQELSEEIGYNASLIKLDDYKVERNEKLARGVSGPAPSANKMQLLIFLTAETLMKLESPWRNSKKSLSFNQPIHNNISTGWWFMWIVMKMPLSIFRKNYLTRCRKEESLRFFFAIMKYMKSINNIKTFMNKTLLFSLTVPG